MEIRNTVRLRGLLNQLLESPVGDTFFVRLSINLVEVCALVRLAGLVLEGPELGLLVELRPGEVQHPHTDTRDKGRSPVVPARQPVDRVI